MSFTVAIHSEVPIEGAMTLKAVSDTSSSFYKPTSDKKTHGFIEVNNQTCVGLAWPLESPADLELVGRRLESRQELKDRTWRIRRVLMNGQEIGVVNSLIPATNFEWMSGVFEGVRARSWVVENTAWYETFDNNPLLTPPRIVPQELKDPFILFSVGRITNYFTGEYDNRGKQYHEAHPDEHITDLPSLMFKDEFKQFGYEEGLRRITIDRNTGMQHGYTIIYPDPRGGVSTAHLLHENAQFTHQVTHDSVGNEIAIIGTVVAERFKKVWPVELNEEFKNIQNVHIRRLGGH